jgi:hypothetical protein
LNGKQSYHSKTPALIRLELALAEVFTGFKLRAFIRLLAPFELYLASQIVLSNQVFIIFSLYFGL